MEVAVGIWVVAVLFIWVVGRAVARQERLVVALEVPGVSWPSRSCWPSAVGSPVTCTTSSVGLAAVMLQVTSARHVLRRDADAAEEALRSAEEVGRRSMQELRRTLTLLRSDDDAAVAEPVSTASEIPTLVDQARGGRSRRRAAHREETSHESRQGRARALPDRAGGVGERRSPRPRARTTLGLEFANGRVALYGGDQQRTCRRWIRLERERPHYGLIGMQERAAALGGKVAAGPTRDGWRVRCELPVEDEGNR